MVQFLNPSQPSEQPLTVWCEPGAEGYRLIRRDPGGSVHTEQVATRSALYEATVRLQADLTRSGWTPVPPVGSSPSRRRSVRSGHFHR